MIETSICQIVFYVFALLAILFAICVVGSRNPVNSAMNMALSFGCVAAILFGLGAQFLGIVQIIVYAGAILVLFLFVVMMLDLKDEERNTGSMRSAAVGTTIAAILAGLITSISLSLPGATEISCPMAAICDNIGELAPGAEATQATPTPGYGGSLPALSPAAAAKAVQPGISDAEAAKATSMQDIRLLGQTLYTQYNIAFVILGFALLSGTVGAVALARKIRKD